MRKRRGTKLPTLSLRKVGAATMPVTRSVTRGPAGGPASPVVNSGSSWSGCEGLELDLVSHLQVGLVGVEVEDRGLVDGVRRSGVRPSRMRGRSIS